MIENGKYYIFDCMNGYLNSRMFEEAEFEKKRAIMIAADHEAVLILAEFRDGERINSEVLYCPIF